MASAGSQMLLGIRLKIDANGVVTGASLADDALEGVKKSAEDTGDAVDQAAKKMEQSFGAGGVLATIGATAVGLGKTIEQKFLNPAIDQAKTFQTEMAQLGFVTKASTQELDSLRGVAIKTGLQTQFAPQQAASAIRMLRAAGLDTKTALESLNATLDVATGSAGMLGLDTAATATAAGILKFKRTGEDARKIMDTFAQATRETNLQFHDLPIVLNSMRAAPARLKLTSAEAWALAGALKNAGMMAAQAGQGVSGFAARLIINQRSVERYLQRHKITEEQLFQLPDTAKMDRRTKAFKDLGVHIFDAQGKMRPMMDVLNDILKASEKLTGESERKFLTVASQFFGEQAGAMIEALKLMERNGKKGAEAFEDLVKSIDKGKGASREAAEAFENTAQGLETFIQGTKETIDILMGETIVPTMMSFHKLWRDILNAVLGFVEKNPVLAKALGTTLAVLSKILIVVGGLALALGAATLASVLLGKGLAAAGGWAGVAKIAFSSLSMVLKGLGAAMGGILLTMGLMYLGMKLWAAIWDKDAKGIFKSIQNVLTDIKLVWRGFVDWSDGASDDIALFDALKERNLDGIVMTLLQWRDRLVAFFGGMWESVKEAFVPIAEVFSWLSDALGSIIDYFRGFTRVIKVTDISDQIQGWRSFGRIVGHLAKVIFPLLLLRMAVLLTKTLVQTAAYMSQGAVLLLLNARMILFAALIAIVVAAYAGLLVLAKRGGEKLGPWLFESAEKAAAKLALLIEGVKRFLGAAADWASAAWDRIFGGGDEAKARMDMASSMMKGAFTVKKGEEDLMRSLVAAQQAGLSDVVAKRTYQLQELRAGRDPEVAGKQWQMLRREQLQREGAKGQAQRGEGAGMSLAGGGVQVGNVVFNSKELSREDMKKAADIFFEEVEKKQDEKNETEFYL